MIGINEIRRWHSGWFNFEERCCFCLKYQKKTGITDHNSYDCKSTFRNKIGCNTCHKEGHSMRFCKFTRCRVCDYKGHIEPDCPKRMRINDLTKQYINTHYNNNPTPSPESDHMITDQQ